MAEFIDKQKLIDYFLGNGAFTDYGKYTPAIVADIMKLPVSNEAPMDVLKDVDGGEWRPVQEDMLQDILEKLDNCISRLEKAEEERDAAVKLCGKLIALCSPPKELKPKLFRRHINRPGDYMGCGYDFLDAFNKIICDFIETSDEAIYDRIDRVARQEILGITNKIVLIIKDG